MGHPENKDSGGQPATSCGVQGHTHWGAHTQPSCSICFWTRTDFTSRPLSHSATPPPLSPAHATTPHLLSLACSGEVRAPSPHSPPYLLYLSHLFLTQQASAKLNRYRAVSGPHPSCTCTSGFPSKLCTALSTPARTGICEKPHLSSNVLWYTSVCLRGQAISGKKNKPNNLLPYKGMAQVYYNLKQ